MNNKFLQCLHCAPLREIDENESIYDNNFNWVLCITFRPLERICDGLWVFSYKLAHWVTDNMCLKFSTGKQHFAILLLHFLWFK